MFCLGKLYIKEYCLLINTPVFSASLLSDDAEKIGYYEVLLTRIVNNILPDGRLFKTLYYINISKSHGDILKLNEKGFPTAESDKIEISSYESRRGTEMPLYLLSRSSIENLINKIL
jgi:hypothetical protein